MLFFYNTFDILIQDGGFFLFNKKNFGIVVKNESSDKMCYVEPTGKPTRSILYRCSSSGSNVCFSCEEEDRISQGHAHLIYIPPFGFTQTPHLLPSSYHHQTKILLLNNTKKKCFIHGRHDNNKIEYQQRETANW